MNKLSKYEEPVNSRHVFRGEIFYARMADLDALSNSNPELAVATKSELKKSRPVIVISNDIANKNQHNPKVIVACISSSPRKLAKYKVKPSPAQMLVTLDRESVIMCDEIRSISKSRLESKLGELDSKQIIELNSTLKKSLGLVWIN